MLSFMVRQIILTKQAGFNVYAALQSLTEQGLISVAKGESAVYTAAPLSDIRRLKEQALSKSLDALEELFPQRQREPGEFYSMEGDRLVTERIELEAMRAEEEIVADLWAEEAVVYGGCLEQAERRGTHVLLSLIGDAAPDVSRLFRHEREEAWQRENGRKFSFVFDRRVAILGVRGSGIRTKAVFSEHPALVSLLLNNFFHDYVLHEIRRDFGPQLEERYGRNYEELYRQLTGHGWKG